jgi:hypothetical protein
MSAALSVLLAGTLAVAAVGKLRDGGGAVLPVLELALAAALLVGAARPAAVAVALLLCAFSLVLRDLARRAQPCRCFGTAGDPVAGQLRNAGLIAAAVVLAARPAAPLWDVPVPELLGAATAALGVACAWSLAQVLA